MSLKAMLWVLEDAEIHEHGDFRLMVALAERADETGRNAWPGVPWLAKRLNRDPRTVFRGLKRLVETGLIFPGDQELVSHLNGRTRPVVYDLAMPGNEPRTDSSVTPESAEGMTSAAPRYDSSDQEGMTSDVIQNVPSLLRSETVQEPSASELALIDPPTDSPPKSLSTKQIDALFDTWYEKYPRKVARPDARKAYTKAVRAVGPEKLLAAASALAAEKRDKQFYPYPATWLNKGHWDSDDLAPKTTSSIDAWLRECWQRGDYRTIEDRSGLTYPQPDIPAELPDRDAVARWLLAQRRQWIVDNVPAITAAVARREGIPA